MLRIMATMLVMVGMAAALVGCAAVNKVRGKPEKEVLVDVPTAKGGDVVQVKVVSYSESDDVARGVSLLDRKNWAEAKRAFRTGADNHKGDEEAFFGLGVSCEMLGEFDQALDAYREADRLDHNESRTKAVDRVSRKIEMKKGGG